MCDQYSPSDEFNVLRNEVLQGKKYVFERPLLIITVSITAFNLIEKPYVPLLLPIAIGLLMFNLWFTVDRLRSIVRITSYIQLKLEEKAFGPWLGWETSLRQYRRWTKLNRSSLRVIIDSKIAREAIPRSSGYYPTVYQMHVVAVAVASAGSVAYAIVNWRITNLVAATTTLLILSLFAVCAIKYRPGRIKSIMEESRAIWIEVFENLQKRDDTADVQLESNPS